MAPRREKKRARLKLPRDGKWYPIATRVSFLFIFVHLEMSLFPSVFSFLYGEYVVRSFLPDGVFLPMTTGWIFDISLRENSINQLKKKM